MDMGQHCCCLSSLYYRFVICSEVIFFGRVGFVAPSSAEVRPASVFLSLDAKWN